VSKFELGWYNGFSPEARRATLPIQKQAIAEGTLAKPEVCSVCGFRNGDAPWPENSVWLHDEDYRRPLDAHPICRRCHGVLHRRFVTPEPWLDLVARHGGRGAWFEALSLDPVSQHRPYDDTYSGRPRSDPADGASPS
jgi:ribosomal protein L40E